MRTTFLIIFLFSYIGFLMAQRDTILWAKTPSNLKIAYNASIIYPGFRAGVEYPIKRIDMTKYRRWRGLRHFSQMRYLSAELGYYHHTDFHDNIYLLAGWQMRKERPRGFFTEFSPAIGYSRTFLGGETYLVDDAGNISLLKGAGYNYAMLAIGGGLGYQFHPQTSAYFRSSLLTMFPNNNLVYLRPTVELGLIWQTRHFWERSTKNISKTKGKKS